MKDSLEALPSHELLTRTHDLVRRGNAVEAELLAHLGEVDARRLYLEQACSSMFVFCLRVLNFSESVAYKRIRAARTARRHPGILAAVRRGELHVTAVSLLAPQLTQKSCAERVRAARHKTADEIRRLLADRQPKPDVPASMRRISEAVASVPVPSAECAETSGPSGSPAAPSAPSGAGQGEPGSLDAGALARPTDPQETRKQRSRSEPLGGERYGVRFTADAALHAQIQELQALMRHQIPDGDIGEILARAVPLLLEQVRKRKFGECSAPKSKKPASGPASRSIPAATRRSVTRRDGEGCTYVSPDGRRCGSRDLLEFHHRDPWADTKDHPPGGITLHCRAHNQHRASRDFGEPHMARFRKGTVAPSSEAPKGERSAGSAAPAQLDLDPARASRAGPPPRSDRETGESAHTKA